MRNMFTDPAEESEEKDPRRTGPRVVKSTEPQASFERSTGPKPGPVAKKPPATAAATNSMPTSNRPLPRNTVAKNLSSRPPIRPGCIADVLQTTAPSAGLGSGTCRRRDLAAVWWQIALCCSRPRRWAEPTEVGLS